MSTIYTLLSTDLINDTFDDINTNFANLNTDKAEDSAVVHDTGNETIAGVKTFTSSPIVPTPTTATQAVNKEYADYTPDFYKYSITTSVASGNLTVALKNYEGNDPTPSKPVKIQIGGVIRTITSALSITINAGANAFNAGSAELATKEIDYFKYFLWDATLSRVGLIITRFPSAMTWADINNASLGTLEKAGYTSSNVNPSSTDVMVVGGRFNAILSAGLAWSIPATSVIINRPCYETREFDMNIIPNGTGTITSIDGVSHMKYKLSGNVVKYNAFIRFNKGTLSGDVGFKLPFTNNKETQASGYVCSVVATTPYTSLGVRFASGITKAVKQSYTAELQYSDIGTDVVFSISGSYTI